jgi:GWxTD domain-containing protein
MNTLIRENKPDAMRLYLFSFWAKENPNNPEEGYKAYMKVARAIDDKFQSGFGHGFETDRGYVFMKYGAPSDAVTVENDPSAPPYEIWTYHQFPRTGQNNVKFLFYNPSLATNGFILLHSTARGEVNNPRWEVELYRNAPNELDDTDYFGGSQMQDNTGRHARRLMRDF